LDSKNVYILQTAPSISFVQVGLVQRVLVTEESHDGAFFVAHNKSYDQARSVYSKSYQAVYFFSRIAHAGNNQKASGGEWSNQGVKRSK